jgi:D-sedoheptulose 7-phosphate isomerase
VSPDFAKLAAVFDRQLDEHLTVAERTRALLLPVAGLAEAAISVLRAGGKLLLCGNGGSAADSQHIATELAVRFETDRAALSAIALTTDTSILTAAGNDLGFDQIFARQVAALGRRGDLLIAITTSGNSPNVIAALEAARAGELATACLTGGDGGTVARKGLADHCLIVPSDRTARIQEIHILIGHFLCSAIDAAFVRKD